MRAGAKAKLGAVRLAANAFTLEASVATKNTSNASCRLAK
jgi:hypothetical protein